MYVGVRGMGCTCGVLVSELVWVLGRIVFALEKRTCPGANVVSHVMHQLPP